MKAKLILGGIAAIAIILGEVWLVAAPQAPEQRQSTPAQARHVIPDHSSATAATPPTLTVGTPNATPSLITVNTSTTVTVTVQINPVPLPGGVNLLRLGTTGTQPTILGVMHDDGKNGDAVANDGMYTLQVVLNSSTPTPLQLEVSAAFSGSLKRVMSGVVNVNFTAIKAIGTLPADWTTYDNTADQSDIFSSQALSSINSGDDETPPDFVISASPNPSSQSLQAFVANYQNGWFAVYNSVSSTTIDGRPAIIADDSNAAVPHVPGLAAFVAGNSSVYVITALTEDASEFLTFLGSLKIPD